MEGVLSTGTTPSSSLTCLLSDSPVKCHVSGVTCHVSRVTCPMSQVACLVSFFFLFSLLFLDKVLVEGLLSMWPPCLV